ncbi:MAG TPA: thiamine pyrophosphate-dependent enzyme, partial [Chitinophagales bacterium]|nr:thiamine pyrophosphate-dependent enzyme [Chitinophagales bacterium]
MPENSTGTAIDFGSFRERVLADYALAVTSREASLLGRKEVLTGKAKFGIFGDGKELPQIALSKFFKNGDFRSGYYRDQTLALATGMVTLRELFSQLYADTDLSREPHSGGRMMNAHFATRLLDNGGKWKNHLEQKNTSADASPTGSQMPRALGLALASKYYRSTTDKSIHQGFSDNGDEVVFATIGDASTSEGVFWETLNAAGVLRVPLVISVWDDGYGISVPIEFQTTKGNISEIVSGFFVNEKGQGLDIYIVNGWDYAALVETYERAVAKTRETHIPCLVHVKEVTQPQGHSTSGSHERYKSKERLDWEREFDCIRKLREWMTANAIATDAELDEIEAQAKVDVNRAKREAWEQYLQPIKDEIQTLNGLVGTLAPVSGETERIEDLKRQLNSLTEPLRRNLVETAREILYATRFESSVERAALAAWTLDYIAQNDRRYNDHLYSSSHQAAMNIEHVPATYDDNAQQLNGFEILNKCFDAALSRDNRIVAFGEDVGRIGDVNQGFAGLQAKHGEDRVFDTGIREATIIGQGMGMAMRGLRPIAEIQYLDYLLYGLQPISDDLATLRYRTANG